MVAFGAINAILLTSFGSNSRFSIFTMSFFPFFPFTFIRILTTETVDSGIFSTCNTFKALPGVM